MSKEQMKKLVESGKAATVTTAAELSEEGWRRIADIIREFAYNEWQGSTRLYTLDYEQIIDGRLLVNRNGKLAKRIRRNLRRLNDLSLPNETISQIGNMAANYTLPADDYTVELTGDCLATVGNFGDDRCCFRPRQPYHHHCIALDNDPNCGAVRIYNGNGNGIARSWYYQEPTDQALCLFNSYGLRLNKIAELVELTGYYGAARKGRISGEIYLNRNGESYIFNGSQDHYFMTVDPDSERCENCEDCNDRIDPEVDDYCYINGQFYCADCINYCDHCGENHATENTEFSTALRPHRFNNGNETITICDCCRYDYFSNCENCDDLYPNSTMISAENDTVAICENCADLVADCEDCDEKILVENCADQRLPRCEDCQTEFDRQPGCEDCQNSPFTRCADCYSKALHDHANLVLSHGSQTLPLIDLIVELAAIRQRRENCIFEAARLRYIDQYGAQLRRNSATATAAYNETVKEVELCQI